MINEVWTSAQKLEIAPWQRHFLFLSFLPSLPLQKCPKWNCPKHLKFFVFPRCTASKEDSRKLRISMMDASEAKYDDLLLGILQNEGQISPFLDVIFGFLYRRTDFYRILREENDKIGFPAGVAERLASQSFTKYKNKAKQDETREEELKSVKLDETVGTNKLDEQPKSAETDVEVEDEAAKLRKANDIASESYNGAVRENYSWSQSSNDLDVCVKVPKNTIKAKMVKVDLGNKHLKVENQVETGWETLLEGALIHKINMEETTWTLVPGEHIHINFEKLEEVWWDALLVDEPKIDVRKLECTKPMSDLPEADLAKIDELMFNERQKQLNMPTTDQMKVHDILREAWDKEGSPFKGTPFDPSVINISGSTDGLLGDQPPST